MFRDADHALGAADEPEGLWSRGRQSGRRRGDRRAKRQAGGGGNSAAARRLQARQAHRDAPPRRIASPLVKKSEEIMTTKNIRIAMDGVTGRLGTNQHLIRSV